MKMSTSWLLISWMVMVNNALPLFGVSCFHLQQPHSQRRQRQTSRSRSRPCSSSHWTVLGRRPVRLQRRQRQRKHKSCTVISAFETELDGVAYAINNFYQSSPYIAGFLTCSVKASAADLVAQTSNTNNQDKSMMKSIRSQEESFLQEEEEDQSYHDGNDYKNEIDLKRNFAFICYGGLYQGLATQFIYNVILPSLYGNDLTFLTTMEKVLTDNLLFAPFVNLPIAYTIQALVSSTDHNQNQNKNKQAEEKCGCGMVSSSSSNAIVDTIQKGLAKYVEDVTEQRLLFQFWSIWIPVQIINFAFIPPQFRIVFVATVSFFWTSLLSRISASASTSATTLTTSPSAAAVADVKSSNTSSL